MKAYSLEDVANTFLNNRNLEKKMLLNWTACVLRTYGEQESSIDVNGIKYYRNRTVMLDFGYGANFSLVLGDRDIGIDK